MCFYNDDYDWCAEVSEVTYARCERDGRCFECGRRIAAGEWRERTLQQEHEDCQICSEYGDYYDDSVMRELCNHDYGETFEAEVCRDCLLMLSAIYDLEEIEGCPEESRRPGYGDLMQVLTDEWVYGDEFKYRRHAMEKYPQLVASRVMQRTVPPPRRSNLIDWATV